KLSSGHLVSCRHRMSGRTALMNFATRSMRKRTELMFQVVMVRRMQKWRIASGEWRIGEEQTLLLSLFATRHSLFAFSHGSLVRVLRVINLEHVRIRPFGRIKIGERDRGVVALRVGHDPL